MPFVLLGGVVIVASIWPNGRQSYGAAPGIDPVLEHVRPMIKRRDAPAISAAADQQAVIRGDRADMRVPVGLLPDEPNYNQPVYRQCAALDRRLNRCRAPLADAVESTVARAARAEKLRRSYVE